MTDIVTLIENSGAIKHGRFKLSDGSLTDYYIDKYMFEADPEVLGAIVDALAERLRDGDVDVVAGPELGAVPLVTAVSLETGLPAAFIRKGEKHRGTQARVEGHIGKGQRVAIIEDVTTTGRTILDSAEVIEEVGGVAQRLLVVVDRNEGAEQRVREGGHELEYLVQVGTDLNLESTVER